jgi:hypothetical protein
MAAHFGNLYALGNNGGRPPKYKSAADLEKKITDFFDWVDDNEDVPTITGLALYLGFNSLQSLLDYSNRNEGHEEFASVIKRGKDLIMGYHEKRLAGTTPTGSIFWLKNFGWKDTQQIDHTNNGNTFNSLSDAELVKRLNQLLTSREKI